MRLSIQVQDKVLQPGQQLRGKIHAEAAAVLRFRGEAVAYCIEPDFDSASPRWIGDCRILLWLEQKVGKGLNEFAFAVPLNSPPSYSGKRFRISYSLELLPGQGQPGQIQEILLQAPASALESEPCRISLLPCEESDEAQTEDEEPKEGLEDFDALEPSGAQSFLQQLLGGDPRMDRILERAVRGKLIEPEALLSMQATLYDYSKALIRIPSKTETARPVEEELFSLALPQPWIVPGTAFPIEFDRLPNPIAREVRVMLVQRQKTRCQGIETLLEETVAEANWSNLQEKTELPIPAGLLPTLQGPHVWVDYRLSIIVKTGKDSLRGSHLVPVLSR